MPWMPWMYVCVCTNLSLFDIFSSTPLPINVGSSCNIILWGWIVKCNPGGDKQTQSNNSITRIEVIPYGFFFILGCQQITQVYCSVLFFLYCHYENLDFGSLVLMVLKWYSKQNKENGLQRN